MNQTIALTSSQFYQYHQLSKHTLDKLMASNYGLDWSNQPDPFRGFEGADRVRLPQPDFVSSLTYFQAMESMMAGQGITGGCDLPDPKTADLKLVSHLLFYGMAISAWKQVIGTQNRWSLRVNPSSGDLHPTETHLLVRDIEGLAGGAYHYFVPQHELELRSEGPFARLLWERLGRSSDCPELIICFTSIFWREAWKYRDRAYRYCHHDMGHALGTIMLSAAALGWSSETIGDFPDDELARFLGLGDGDERPALLIGLRPGASAARIDSASPSDTWAAQEAIFRGAANQLSPVVVPYPSIDEAYKSTCLSFEKWLEKRSQAESESFLQPVSDRSRHVSACGTEIGMTYEPSSQMSDERVHEIIRKRRSAVDMDGKQRMKLEHLSTMLVSSTRGFNSDFQRALGWLPQSAESNQSHYLIHLYLYVHRVDGVEPGIYYFNREAQSLVPLSYSDQKGAAKFYSCFQDIAADGCFAVSMIADLDLAFALHGNRCYRYAHYEAGWIGQWLYLSAVALGYEATGIGCFIDDLINQHLDLPPGYEVLYNFTVGRAVVDPRLTTLPSYQFPDPSLG